MRFLTVHIARGVRFIATLLAFLLPFSSYAETTGEQLSLANTWITDELGHIQVSALHIDHLYNLWIGTQSGLYLLTGNHIVEHDTLGAPLKDVFGLGVTAIEEDSGGNVYIGTYGLGLVNIDLKTGATTHVTKLGGYDVSFAEKLFAFSNDVLWIVTPDRLLIAKSFSQQLIVSDISERIQSLVGKVHSVDQVSPDKYLVGGEIGVIVANLGSNDAAATSHHRIPRGDWEKMTASLYLSEQLLVFGTENGQVGVYNLKTKDIESLSQLNSPTSPRILSIKTFGDGIAFSTDHGLFLSDTELRTIEEVKSTNSKRKNYSVSSFVVDRDTIWVGSLSGIRLLKRSIFDRFEASEGLMNDDILDIEEDQDGRLWLGTFDGLYRFDSKTQTHTRVDDPDTWPLGYSSRISVVTALKDSLWLGFIMGRGLIEVDTDTLEAREIPAFQGEVLSILDIKVTEEAIWIGTHEKGLIRYTPERTERFLDEGVLPATSVSEILPTSDGILALATIQNVLLYDPITKSYREVELDLAHKKLTPEILEIFEDRRGNLWIGTASQGLFVASRNSLSSDFPTAKRYSFDSFLDSASITNICATSSGEFWVSAGNRIARFIPYKRDVYLYNSSDGLPFADMATDSSLCSTSGALYFGSSQGYSRLTKIPLVPDYHSEANIVEIGAAGKILTSVFPFPSPQELIVGSNDFPLSIKLVVRDYQEPDNIQFRYRLVGENAPWNYNGDSGYLFLPALAVGQHTLSIQATNSNGIWNDDVTSLNIIVHPPPWQTTWAYCFYVIAALGILWSIHRIYYSYVVERRSEELAIEIEETRNRAEDEVQEQLEYHDELAQAAHQHHGSILKLLQHCLSETIPEHEGEPWGDSAEGSPSYMKALSLLENCTVYDEGDVSIDLAVFVEKLFPAIMPYCQVDQGTIITVNEVKADPITLEVGTTLAVIIYELAVNAISHAYADDSPANYLRVISRTEYSKETEKETYSITVRDSGEGIQEDAIDTAPPSSGIALVQSLADSIDAKLSYSYRKGTMAKVTLEVTESRPIFA